MENQESCFYDLAIFIFSFSANFHKVILRVLLAIIYIISHLLFKKSDTKSTLWWNWYSPRQRYIWSIIAGLIFTKVRYRLWTPGYRLFCEIKWSISGAHGNRFFDFILSFTTAITNRRYHNSKNLIISVVCTGLFILLCGS